MAEEIVPAPTPPTPGNPEDETLRPEGMRALVAEREKNKKLAADLQAIQAWKTEQENAGKSEVERLTAELAQLKSSGSASQNELLRLRVAVEKKLTAKQAARLVGSDEASLLADADDFLADLKPAGEDDQEQPGPILDDRPRERLKGGARPKDEAAVLDPAELAASIRRGI